MTAEWKPEHFALKQYGLDGPELDGERTRIRLVIQVNGRTEIDMTNTRVEFEPGMIAFLSRPDERGLHVVKVVPAREGAIIDGFGEADPAPGWALEAMGLSRD